LEVSGPAAARVDRPRLSASTMNALGSCPARFAAEKLLPGGEDKHSPAFVGGAVHTVLEKLLALPPAGRTQDAAISLVIDQAGRTWGEGQEVDRLRWSANVMGKTLGLFDIEDPAGVDVLGVEQQLNVDL